MMLSPQAPPKLFSSDSCYSVYTPLSAGGFSPFISQTSTAPTSLGESESPAAISPSANKFDFSNNSAASPHRFKLSSQGYPFPWVLSRPSTPPLLSINRRSAATTPLNENSVWSSSSSSCVSDTVCSPISPFGLHGNSRPRPNLPITTSSPSADSSAPSTPWEHAERRSKNAGSTPGAPAVAAFIPVHEQDKMNTNQKNRAKFASLNFGLSSLSQAREKRRSCVSEEKPRIETVLASQTAEKLNVAGEGGQGREGMIEGKHAD